VSDITVVSLKAKVIGLERRITALIAPQLDEIRAHAGDPVANEVMMSVASLFAARAVAFQHVSTAQSVEAIRESFIGAFDANLKLSLGILAKQVENELKNRSHEKGQFS
jgi:hypothetical protein